MPQRKGIIHCQDDGTGSDFRLNVAWIRRVDPQNQLRRGFLSSDPFLDTLDCAPLAAKEVHAQDLPEYPRAEAH